MKAARMEFTTSHLHWTPEDWCKVSYTDESTFRLVRGGTCYVRRGKGANRSEQKFYRPTVKHSASIMIWGMFDGRYSRWDISFVPRRGKNRKTMDTKKYITHVKNHFLRRHRARGSTHLMYSTILFEKKIQNIFNRKYSCGVFKPNAAFGLVTPLHMVRSGLN